VEFPAKRKYEDYNPATFVSKYIRSRKGYMPQWKPSGVTAACYALTRSIFYKKWKSHYNNADKNHKKYIGDKIGESAEHNTRQESNAPPLSPSEYQVSQTD
jgi:hypothetical protein